MPLHLQLRVPLKRESQNDGGSFLGSFLGSLGRLRNLALTQKLSLNSLPPLLHHSEQNTVLRENLFALSYLQVRPKITYIPLKDMVAQHKSRATISFLPYLIVLLLLGGAFTVDFVKQNLAQAHLLGRNLYIFIRLDILQSLLQ